jgi:putrescine transport system substrate-binding protein
MGKGGIVFFDTMAIPADSKNVDNAYAWINYYLDAKVGATMTNGLNYATANKASLEFVSPEAKANKTIFVEADALKNMAMRRLPESQDARKAVVTVFSQFKSTK